MKLITKIIAGFAVLLLWQCASDSAPTIERPHSPWVFRSVLDEQPRMITLALHDKVWAAYSTQDAALYKVWSGNVNFDGAVYTTAHGPQPMSIGDAWLVNEHKNPWKISKNGSEIAGYLMVKKFKFQKVQKLKFRKQD